MEARMRVTRLLLAGCMVLLLGGCDQKEAPGSQAEVELETEAVKTAYTLGYGMTYNAIGPMGTEFSEAEVEALVAGAREALAGEDSRVSMAEYVTKIQPFLNERMNQRLEKEKEKEKVHLDQAAAEDGAVQRPSGLVYRELVTGSGPTPAETDSVVVHYQGALVDGTVFESSIELGEPVPFRANKVIKGWVEALGLMRVGTKAKLTIPFDLAYGPQVQNTIPAFSTLVFEVELLKIIK